MANYSDNTVTELNASDGSLVQTIPVVDLSRAVSSDGTHVWVTSLETVTELNASDGSLVQTILVGIDAQAVFSDGTYVWVANEYRQHGDRAQRLRRLVGQTIPRGQQSHGVSSEGTHVWVTNFYNPNQPPYGGTVTELNASGRLVGP